MMCNKEVKKKITFEPFERGERDKIMNAFQDMHDNVMNVLDSFNLFLDDHIDANGATLIEHEQLDKVPYNIKFDSDGNGVILNEKIKSDIPGFHFISEMKPKGYIKSHKHEADKILKTLEGKFYDHFSKKWYNKEEYLNLKAMSPHSVLAGNEGAKLLTFIMPKDETNE